MVSITLEGLWMFSDRIVRFSIFRQISQVRTCNNFQFLNYHEHVSYGSKKLLIKPRFIRTSSRWSVLLWKDCGWFLIGLSIFDFSSNSQIRTCNNFQFLNYHGACKLCIKKVPNQAKIYQELIKMVSITLEGLWMFSDRMFHFQFFVKFHRSGPATIFSFWTITEHVRCIKKAPNKAKIYQKSRFNITLEGLWMFSDRIVEIFCQNSQVRTCNNFQFLNYHEAC